MRDEKMLKTVLQITGGVMMLAIVFIFCPFSWMQAIHKMIGLGELPFTPLMAYLTRSLSGLYVLLGFVLVFIARDIPRYLELLRALTWLSLAASVCLAVYDFVIEMPLFWSLSEGPATILLCAAILLLCRNIGRTS